MVHGESVRSRGPGGRFDTGHARFGRIALAAIAVFMSAAGVRAQDSGNGRSVYAENCAVCHGADATGKRMKGDTLKVKPADLTLLARRNGGVFSPSAVHAMIDRRKALRAHPDSEMPIWGCRRAPPSDRRTQASKQRSFDSFFDLSCDSEAVIQKRIRDVVEYLRLIQKQ